MGHGVAPARRKGAMMRKNRIWAAVCSLVFVMNCAACGGAEQEALLIGRQEASQGGIQGTEQEASRGGTWETAQGASQGGMQGTAQGVSRAGMQGTAQGASRAGVQEASSGQAGSLQGPETQGICVHVCGAVETPGVVYLPPGSRAADALEAAGGFAADAAEEAVNLAAQVSDGEKIYFPAREEYEVQAEQEKAAASGLVNINTADIDKLCTLPGIGESRAADIIAYRESHGSFAACEDIMQVSGIKDSVYNKIRGRITVK